MALALRLRSRMAPLCPNTDRTNLFPPDCHSRRRLSILHRPVRENGYTLHEALIALVIAGILTASAVGFRRLVMHNKITTQVNVMVADLNLARSEAIKRGQTVTLCQSNTRTDCTGSSDWHEGWILFADANNNRSLDDDEEPIRTQEALSHGTSLEFRGSGRGRDHYVTYWPQGFATPNGTFSFCNSQGSAAPRAIILYWTGRARTSTENAEGGRLACP